MPIISFTESDKLVAVVADAGWYKAVIKEMEMKGSTSEKTVNFWTTFELTEGKYATKEIKCCFNTGVSNASLLGGMQFRPHTDMLPLYAAINNIPNISDVPLNFNTDDMLMKEFDLQVLVDVAEGAPLNKTGGFVPANKATGAQALAF